MHVLGDVSTRLARLPASTGSDVHAGMSFTMLRGVEPLLPGAIERLLLNERIAGLSQSRMSIGAVARKALTRASETLSRF